MKDKEGNIIGAISLGYVLSNNEFVNQQKKLFNCDSTIFFGNERIATTIVDGTGKSIVGSKLDNTMITDTVLKNGKQYQGEAIIQNSLRNRLILTRKLGCHKNAIRTFHMDFRFSIWFSAPPICASRY